MLTFRLCSHGGSCKSRIVFFITIHETHILWSNKTINTGELSYTFNTEQLHTYMQGVSTRNVKFKHCSVLTLPFRMKEGRNWTTDAKLPTYRKSWLELQIFHNSEIFLKSIKKQTSLWECFAVQCSSMTHDNHQFHSHQKLTSSSRIQVGKKRKQHSEQKNINTISNESCPRRQQDAAGVNLIREIMTNEYHLLYSLLPLTTTASQDHNIWSEAHNRHKLGTKLTNSIKRI